MLYILKNNAFMSYLLQVVYYQCISWLHMGMFAEENQKMGERVTYYQVQIQIYWQQTNLIPMGR